MTNDPARALGDRLDRLPLSRFHRRLVIALAGMILFEWVETYSFAFVAPALRAQWGMSLSFIAVVVGVGSLGAFAGGIAAGHMADRIGRRPTLLVFAAVYVVATVACVAVQSPAQLLVARCVAYVGTQGMAVVAIVVLTEFVPPAVRGRLQTYKAAVGALGIPLAAWAGYLLVPHWSWGWRLVFAIGLFGAVFAVLIWRWVPESPRWLASRGRTEEAHAVVADIERQCGVTAPAVDVAEGAAPAPRARARELLTGPYRGRFLVVTVMWVTGLLAYAAFNTWTPTLLKENGLEISDSLLISAILATAAPVGALIAVPLIDRWERRTSLLVLCALTAVALLAFGALRSTAATIVLGCLVSLLFQTSVPFLQVYSAEAFPTRMRALGSGTANAMSRVFNFAAPTLVAAIYTGVGYTAVFVFLAVLSAVGGLVAALFGPRTTGVSLEDAHTAAPALQRSANGAR